MREWGRLYAETPPRLRVDLRAITEAVAQALRFTSNPNLSQEGRELLALAARHDLRGLL